MSIGKTAIAIRPGLESGSLEYFLTACDRGGVARDGFSGSQFHEQPFDLALLIRAGRAGFHVSKFPRSGQLKQHLAGTSPYGYDSTGNAGE